MARNHDSDFRLIEQEGMCMVAYREQAPSKNSNHKLRINNEHLSNTTVLAVLRLVPPKAEFELDESSFVQNKFALVHIRWKTPTLESHYAIPQLWLLKMHPKTHEKYIQFCLTPAAQVCLNFFCPQQYVDLHLRTYLNKPVIGATPPNRLT